MHTLVEVKQASIICLVGSCGGWWWYAGKQRYKVVLVRWSLWFQLACQFPSVTPAWCQGPTEREGRGDAVMCGETGGELRTDGGGLVSSTQVSLTLTPKHSTSTTSNICEIRALHSKLFQNWWFRIFKNCPLIATKRSPKNPQSSWLLSLSPSSWSSSWPSSSSSYYLETATRTIKFPSNPEVLEYAISSVSFVKLV